MKMMNLFLAAVLVLTAGCAAEKKEDTVVIGENGINTVQFDGKEMDFFRFGNENGPKLVILPGLSLKSVMNSKDAVIDGYSLLAENYDIFLFERIREIPEQYTISDMADDMIRAFKAAGIEDANIMGVSLGGMIALTMAEREPQHVHSLMLCSTAARLGDTAVLETWKQLAEERNLAALMESFGEYVYTPSFFEQYKDLIIASGEGASEQDYKNFIASIQGTTGFDCYDQLKNIQCSSLVIGASEDRILGPDASKELAEQLNSEIFIYEGYGHGAYDEAPDYRSHIKAFLDKVTK